MTELMTKAELKLLVEESIYYYVAFHHRWSWNYHVKNSDDEYVALLERLRVEHNIEVSVP